MYFLVLLSSSECFSLRQCQTNDLDMEAVRHRQLENESGWSLYHPNVTKKRKKCSYWQIQWPRSSLCKLKHRLVRVSEFHIATRGIVQFDCRSFSNINETSILAFFWIFLSTWSSAYFQYFPFCSWYQPLVAIIRARKYILYGQSILKA